MKDIQGREYAKITEVNPGSLITVDGDFTCVKPWSTHEVKYDEAEGFHFIECDCGCHDLGGQLADDGIHLIGIYAGRVEQ